MSTRPYQPLARRYRPTRFEGEGGLIGQPHVVRTLKNAIQTEQVANAYLFTGPRGTGKTTAARILAAALNCENRPDDGEPCGDCETCTRILGGKESTDVVEIDAATHRGADDARSLRQQAMYAPSSEHSARVFVLDEAHMLTKEAWNALLKILEEPPPRVHFVFCTTEPQKIQQSAPPILSRCQRLDMRRLTHDDIVAHLTRLAEKEGLRILPEAIVLIARRADGGMRDALSMLDQITAFQGSDEISVDSVREAFGMEPEKTYLAVIDLVAAHERGRIFSLVRHLDRSGADFVRFLEDWQDTLAALAEVQEGGTADEWSETAQNSLRKKAGYRNENGQSARAAPPLIPTPTLVELMALCQDESLIIRQASRPATLVMTLLQRSITLLESEEESGRGEA